MSIGVLWKLIKIFLKGRRNKFLGIKWMKYYVLYYVGYVYCK